MAIPAKRFEFLDQETNIAVTDFLRVTDKNIYNRDQENIKATINDVESLINKSLKDKLIELGRLDNTTIDRITKSMNEVTRDLSNLSAKDIDKLITSIFSENPQSKTIVGQLTNECKTKGLNGKGLGKAFDPTISCNGKNKKTSNKACSSNTISNLLSKLSGGVYNATYTNLNNALMILMMLSKQGYDLNMCGVFSALAGIVGDNTALSRASGSLLSYLATNKNTNGIIDLANSASGLHTLIENPKGIVQALNNFKIPNDVKDHQLRDYVDQYDSALTLLDDDWRTSGTKISIAKTDTYNEELDKGLFSKAISNVFNQNNLDTIPDNDFAFIDVSYKLKQLNV